MVLLAFNAVFGMSLPVLFTAAANETYHSGAVGYGLYSSLAALGAFAGAMLSSLRRDGAAAEPGRQRSIVYGLVTAFAGRRAALRAVPRVARGHRRRPPALRHRGRVDHPALHQPGDPRPGDVVLHHGAGRRAGDRRPADGLDRGALRLVGRVRDRGRAARTGRHHGRHHPGAAAPAADRGQPADAAADAAHRQAQRRPRGRGARLRSSAPARSGPAGARPRRPRAPASPAGRSGS